MTLDRHASCPPQVLFGESEDPLPERIRQHHARGSAPRVGLHVTGTTWGQPYTVARGDVHMLEN